MIAKGKEILLQLPAVLHMVLLQKQKSRCYTVTLPIPSAQDYHTSLSTLGY